MSFLKSLFGGGRKPAEEKPAGPVKSIEHNGFTIHAMPYKEEGGYQLCGVIEKVVEGETKSHRFIRADRFPGEEDAANFTLTKGQQIVDTEGERIFR